MNNKLDIYDGLYGVFVEMGCGMPISQNILLCDGASRIVKEVICPYSKESQEFHFGKSDFRSVSKDRVNEILTKIRFNPLYHDCNLFVVSSFQVGLDKVNHGWIGVCLNGSSSFYHITLPPYDEDDATWRIEYKSNRDVLCDIIYNAFENIIDKNKIVTHYNRGYTIDIVSGSEDRSIFELDCSRGSSRNLYLFGKRCNKTFRVEELFRNNPDELTIFKGSFNPIHKAHMEMANYFQDRGIGKTIFMISRATNGKGFIKTEDLLNRIKLITQNGVDQYDVLINDYPNFEDAVYALRLRGYKGKIRFIMGQDTAIRLKNDNNFPEDANVEYVYFGRGERNLNLEKDERFKYIEYNNPISSTQIRNGEIQ